MGALDRFVERKQILENMDRILLHHKQVQQEKATNQQSLFTASVKGTTQTLVLRDAEPATMRELLSWEKELLGLYVSSHPFMPIQEALKEHIIASTQIPTTADGVFVRTGGIVTSVKQIVTNHRGQVSIKSGSTGTQVAIEL